MALFASLATCTIWVHGQDNASPERFVELNDRAAVVFKEGKLEEAVGLLQESIRLQPKNSTSHGNLGEVFYWLGRYAESAAAFERAASLEPTKSLYHNALGVAYGKLGRPAEGIAAVEKAIAIDQVGVYYQNVGSLFLQSGDSKRALPYMEKAVALEPSDADLRYALGYGYARLSKNSQAIAELEKAVELDANHADARTVLAHLFIKEGDREKALEQYRWLESNKSPAAAELFAAISKGSVVRVPEKQ